MTSAIILAAGLGSRLKHLTAATPKALIEVGGRPLIDYALAFARATGADRRIVVGGFCHADVAARARAVAADAHIEENADFRKGNIFTLLAGRRALPAAGGFLLMNTDHVYRPAIADIVARAIAVAEAGGEVTAFCDFDRPLGPDDMKVELDAAGHVARMAKTLPEWDCGYVGMTYVPAARRADYFAAAPAVHAAAGEGAHVEAMLTHLAATGSPPRIADISGHGWLEIDEPHERAHADEVLARERWWPHVL